MEAHQERVVTEKKELDENIEKLNTFTDGDFFKTLPLMEQSRLARQLHAMTTYSEILGERIAEF